MPDIGNTTFNNAMSFKLLTVYNSKMKADKEIHNFNIQWAYRTKYLKRLQTTGKEHTWRFFFKVTFSKMNKSTPL